MSPFSFEEFHYKKPQSTKDWWPGEGSEYGEIPISEDFINGYVDAAVRNAAGETISGNRLHTFDDFSSEAIRQVIRETNEFVRANLADLKALITRGRANMYMHGIDFWLTRNRTGIGFFSNKYGKIGDRLTRKARAYGEAHLYEDDADGKLYWE